MKKVLFSPGFGAGWSSWGPGDKQQQVAEYQPIIEFLEAGNDAEGKEFDALVDQMQRELEIDSFYRGGARDLEVRTVSGPYKIEEYDGNEYIVEAFDLWQ